MQARLLILSIYTIFTLLANCQTSKIYEKITGDDPLAYNHSDNFSAWQEISDESIKKGKLKSVYYRVAICTTILNKKYGTLAHPMAKIEVKAPDELKEPGTSITGFLCIPGQKLIFSDKLSQQVNDTIKQFFYVTPSEKIFSVEIIIEFNKLDPTYLSIFDNDISEVYSKPETLSQKTNDEKDQALEPGMKSKEDISDEQTKETFKLFFGPNAADGLTIKDEDKKQAKLFLIELMQGSCKMAIVEGLRSLEPTLISAIELLHTSISNCNAAKRGAYYEIVRSTIARNFKSTFTRRKQSGEW